jgi:hypothetical protein
MNTFLVESEKKFRQLAEKRDNREENMDKNKRKKKKVKKRKQRIERKRYQTKINE